MDGQCTITIGGNDIALKFNRYAIEVATTVKGSDSLYKNLIAQIWGGICGAAFAKQTDVAVTFEQVVDWVEEQDLNRDPDKQFDKIREAFQTSLVYKSLIVPSAKKEDATEETDEKKSSDLTNSDSSSPVN